MADTIDGINVKLSVNSDEFVTQMKQCESSVDKAEKELGTLEGTTESVSKEQKKFGDNVEKATESLKKHSSQTEEATSKTKSLTDESKKMSSGFDNAKGALDGVNKVLGVFGVSVGVAALISQVKELAERAVTARAEYENLYNQIYFTAGSLSESQQKLADDMTSSFGKDYSDAIANAIGGVSTFFPDATEEQLKSISEELITMQKRGFGDTATNVNLLNDLVKRYKVNLDDVVGLLSYLSATAMDTGESVSTLMNSVANADEMSKVLNQDIYKSIDFFGNAKAAGNAGDVQGIDTRFETEFNAMVAEKAKSYADTGFSSIKAYEKATEDVTKIFRDTNKKAAEAVSQVDASRIWAETLGIEVGKISNVFADYSMATSSSEYPISYTQRDLVKYTGKTLTQESKNKETTSDIQAQNDAAVDKWLSESAYARADEFAEYLGRYAREQSGGDVFKGIVTALDYKILSLTGLDSLFTEDILEVPELSDKYQEIYGMSNYDKFSSIFGDVKLPDGMTELTDSADTIEEFTEESLTPMNDSLLTTSDNLTLINDNSVLYDEQTYGLTIPAMKDETQNTNNLAAAWWEAYRAKLAYQSL